MLMMTQDAVSGSFDTIASRVYKACSPEALQAKAWPRPGDGHFAP